MTGKPELPVTVFSDYICPFCYIGFLRLEKLRTHFDLKVNWALLEIHPDNPEHGRPVSELGYSPRQFSAMEQALTEMADAEGISLAPRTVTTNSRRALLMAEASKAEGREVFYAVHRSLFETYFVEGRNIADPGVLHSVAKNAGLRVEVMEKAWSDPALLTRLQHNLRAAVDLGVTGTPTYFFGERKLTGAVPETTLLDAARGTAR